jgi:phosphomannomutase
MKNLFIFDLDNTLTVSKSALTDSMSLLLKELLEKTKVAIISGGDYPQFEEHVTPHLLKVKSQLNNMYYLPTTGTKFYVFENNKPRNLYSYELTKDEKNLIIDLIKLNSKDLVTEDVYGEQIEDRKTQITFSALGQNAPPEIKKAWDPVQEKRNKLKGRISEQLKDFTISINGGTSLNITKQGMDKSFGVRKLQEYLQIPIEDMIFIGDELDENGNDYPVRSLGIECIEVQNHLETESILKKILQNV